MHLIKFINIILLSTFLTLLTIDFVNSLRDVRVKIPHAVRRGEKAILKCLYDIEDDSLYSVKWYKGRREFYSFTPKESPAMKVFQFQGVKVERSASNESQLVLDSVNLATSGKYSCEVSADAPSFHTLISAGELEVVEVPGKDPIITGIRPRYRVGDIVRGNCTSRHSKPAANLTWTINGYETNPSHIRHHKPLKDPREMETAISGIHFVVTPQHFVYGKLKIRCTAYIHDVYWKSTEKSIEEERHKHNTGNSINLVNTFSEDYFDLEDGNLLDRSDTYMTHIKGDVSSLNANGAGSSVHHWHHCNMPILPRLTILALLVYTIQQMLQLWWQLFNYDSTKATTQTTMAKTTQKTTIEKASDVNNNSNNNNSNNNNKSVEGNSRRSNCNNTKGQQLSGTSSASSIHSCYCCCSVATTIATTRTTPANCKLLKRLNINNKMQLQQQQQQQQQTNEKKNLNEKKYENENFVLTKRKAQQQQQQQQQQYLSSKSTTLALTKVAIVIATTTTTTASPTTTHCYNNNNTITIAT